MNIGQVLEIHLSLAAKALGFNISTPVFDGANEIDIMDTLDLANDMIMSIWNGKNLIKSTERNCFRKYGSISMTIVRIVHCGKAFRFPVTEKSA